MAPVSPLELCIVRIKYLVRSALRRGTDRALGFRRDLAVVEFPGDELTSVLCVTVEWVPLTCGVPSSVPHSLSVF